LRAGYSLAELLCVFAAGLQDRGEGNVVHVATEWRGNKHMAHEQARYLTVEIPDVAPSDRKKQSSLDLSSAISERR
jgi:hypothetical protein